MATPMRFVLMPSGNGNMCPNRDIAARFWIRNRKTVRPMSWTCRRRNPSERRSPTHSRASQI
jgi:hypothetical protein